MIRETHIIDDVGRGALADMVGQELKSYCSDMDCPDRAFVVVVLRLAEFDLEMRIREIATESQNEWIKEMSTVGVSNTPMNKVEASAGQIDKDGNYVPNQFISHPIGKRVKHVSVITEKICRDCGNGESEVLTFTRGVVLDFGDSFIAFDKLECWGEVWTITTGTTGRYCPGFTERNDEAPEFTTSVNVERIA